MRPLFRREQDRIASRWCESSDGIAFQISKINPALRLQHHKRQGITINSYRSGELTCGRFCTGIEGLFPAVRTGPLVTEKLTAAGKTKIRRAIQNSSVDFRCLMTVTFSPSLSELDYSDPNKPVISQKWGKEKFKRFIHSIKVACDRRHVTSGGSFDRLAYVWVAELQASGNIHFHVLLNHRFPVLWLTRLWGQAPNSIDVRRVHNQHHAGCYLRKYISKGESLIIGNRYGISQNLRETMRSIKFSTDCKDETKRIHELLYALKEDVESNGGKVFDYGFFIPPPSRPVVYRNGKKINKTKGVNGQLVPFILREVDEIIDPIPF